MRLEQVLFCCDTLVEPRAAHDKIESRMHSTCNQQRAPVFEELQHASEQQDPIWTYATQNVHIVSFRWQLIWESGPNSQLQHFTRHLESNCLTSPGHRICKRHELSDHIAAWMTKMGKVRFHRHRISQDGGHISKCHVLHGFTLSWKSPSGNLAPLAPWHG